VSSYIKRFSLTVSFAALSLSLTACMTPTIKKPAPPVETLRPVSFAELPGWAEDDLRQAWPALMTSCDALAKKPDWREVCTLAAAIDPSDALVVRGYFESHFIPHQVTNADASVTGMVTGYYEPLLRGSRLRIGPFQTALYRVPEDLLTIELSSLHPELKNKRLRGKLVGNKVVPYLSRAEITQQNALAGAELIWVDNPVEAFFLQVQGSGRVYIEESKETVRVAYADQNGHPYKSIGRYLVELGELKLEQASAQNIVAWAAANPARLSELLNVNPSFVFFREEKLNNPNQGPKGALGVALTARRSIAIDPQFIPLGAPVFLASTAPGSQIPLRRLMMAQDTGGAIRNAVRADFFWGFGAEAGEQAGKMKQVGMMWVLLPKAFVQRPRQIGRD
jgi:membrane-bound lytic murein transglycosylase A